MAGAPIAAPPATSPRGAKRPAPKTIWACAGQDSQGYGASRCCTCQGVQRRTAFEDDQSLLTPSRRIDLPQVGRSNSRDQISMFQTAA
eukprot:1897123-Rhodomonas_salina.4